MSQCLSCSAGLSRCSCDCCEVEPPEARVHCVWDGRGHSESGEYQQVDGKMDFQDTSSPTRSHGLPAGNESPLSVCL